MPATDAERQRKRREKLKREAPEQYEETKRKHAEYMRNKRKTIKELTDTEKTRRRQQWREANQRRRDKKSKLEKSQINSAHIKRNAAILEKIADCQQCVEKLIKENSALKKIIYRQNITIKRLKETLSLGQTTKIPIKTATSTALTANTPLSKTEVVFNNISLATSEDKESVKILEHNILSESLAHSYVVNGNKTKDILETFVMK